jgi:EpsI family protein
MTKDPQDLGPQNLGDVRLDRRKMLLALGMVAASGTAFARMPAPDQPTIAKDKFEGLIPDVAGPWRFASESGVVLPPPDALSDRLYDNLVTRVYTEPSGGAVMFLIAYNNQQDGVLQIHRPEICYPAGGYTLTPTRDADLRLADGRMLPAKSFVASSRDRDETVLYWTRLGTEFPRRWSDQRLAVIRANLRGTIPDGLLVRVSSLGREMTTELAMLESFISQFVDAAPAGLRRVLFGSALT